MVFTSTCYSLFSPEAVRFFLTISTWLRELLVFILPFLLFSFVAVALSAIPREGMVFVSGLMVIVFISNFMHVLIAGGVGFSILSGAQAHSMPEAKTIFLPYFTLDLPCVMESTKALLVGIAVGIFNSLYPNERVSKIVHFIHNCVMKFVKNFFIPMLPVFVGGFLLRLFSEGRMTGFLEQNIGPCLMIYGFLICYFSLWTWGLASFNIQRTMEIFKNMLPAVVTAFSTMSSSAALPFSIKAAEKNTGDKLLADAVMPLTVNFHMVGDIFAIPILSMLVMLAFNRPLPSTYEFLVFGMLFVLNKFAGGGVPSGTIMVTVPILRDHFKFDDAMIAFIIAFVEMLDAFSTSGNVIGNNLFVIVFQKIRNRARKVFLRTRKKSAHA